jgi:mono/diheme cytochrome c family protein
MRILGCTIAWLVLTVGTFAAQETVVTPPLPPLPSELPVLSPAQNSAPRRVVPVTRPRANISLPQFPQRSLTNAVPAQPRYQPTNVPDTVLQWDATEKEVHPNVGDLESNFSFALTNVSDTNVTINWVRPSCGCTVAKLPPTPWTLKPGEGGVIDFTLDLRGKSGTLSKYVSVDTSHGQRILMIKVIIPQATAMPGMDGRAKNMQLAMADRQVVFRGDCASCHATPTVGKKGEELYTAACAICHDTPNRATMVPDLHAVKKATNAEYWAFWIANGKPGTLMPGFAKAHGGPLDEEQIRSLAEFMFEKFPRAEGISTISNGGAGSSTNAATTPGSAPRASLSLPASGSAPANPVGAGN